MNETIDEKIEQIENEMENMVYEMERLKSKKTILEIRKYVEMYKNLEFEQKEAMIKTMLEYVMEITSFHYIIDVQTTEQGMNVNDFIMVVLGEDGTHLLTLEQFWHYEFDEEDKGLELGLDNYEQIHNGWKTMEMLL